MHYDLPRGKTIPRDAVAPGDTVNGWQFLECVPAPRVKVRCRCLCGEEKSVAADNILRGLSRRCSTCSGRASKTTHGDSDAGGKVSAARLYRIWKAMKWRCNPRNHHDSTYYHGKGISVCPTWQGSYSAFRDWSLQNGYSDGLTIDRIDSSENYEPTNCRWADYTAQARNRLSSRYTAFGETKSAVEWSEDPRVVVCYGTLRGRLERGVDPTVAITTPAGRLRAPF